MKLSFEERLCFVFETAPSRLPEIFWSYTDHDIKTQTKLKLGLRVVTMTQEYVTLLNAAGAIFGGGNSKGTKATPKGRIPKDENEAMALAQAVFS